MNACWRWQFDQRHRDIHVSTRVLSGLLLGTGLAVATGESSAAQTMDYNGYRYTCQTRCEILVRDGTARVVDAAGGETHRRRLMSTPPPNCNQIWICEG